MNCHQFERKTEKRKKKQVQFSFFFSSQTRHSHTKRYTHLNIFRRAQLTTDVPVHYKRNASIIYSLNSFLFIIPSFFTIAHSFLFRLCSPHCILYRIVLEKNKYSDFKNRWIISFCPMLISWIMFGCLGILSCYIGYSDCQQKLD